MVLSSGMMNQQQVAVLPSEELQVIGRQFLVLMVLQGAGLVTTMVFGELWVIMALLASICGYMAVKNKEAYQPGTMLMFFNMNVFATAFGFASWAVSLSKVIGPRNPKAWDAQRSAVPSLVLWSVTLLFMCLTDRFAWVLYKGMLASPVTSGVSQQPPPSYAPQPQQSTGPQGFQPFQGSGMRLG